MLDKIARVPEILMRHWQAIATFVIAQYGLNYIYQMMPRNTIINAIERGISFGVGMAIWDMK